MNHPRHMPGRRGFTIAEMVVATAVLLLMVALMAVILQGAQNIWRSNAAKIVQFQMARVAFERMTHRLSAASLHTYWRPHDTDPSEDVTVLRYHRHSELHFLCGPTRGFISSDEIEDAHRLPGHSLFFQAGLGVSSSGSSRDLSPLGQLLNGLGYFVLEDVDREMPAFLQKTHGLQQRFRLMEVTVPAEELDLFPHRHLTQGDAPSTLAIPSRVQPDFLTVDGEPYRPMVTSAREPQDFIRPLWLGKALMRGADGRFIRARALAENVIALIVLPKKADADRKARSIAGSTNLLTPDVEQIGEIAPRYRYDSWRLLDDAQIAGPRDHLLPPMVQVMLVALESSGPDTLPVRKEWLMTAGGEPLFDRVKTQSDFARDLETMERNLAEAHLRSRVFMMDVVLRSAKWDSEWAR